MKKNTYISIFKSLVLGISVLGFTACTKIEPTYLELSIFSDKELNQDKQNISSPLMLLFYELESAEKFSKLSYWDILEKNGENLNNDLISQSKHVIVPNEEHVYKIAFEKRAKYLGIIGKFSDISKPTWRHVINLEEGEINEIELKVIDYLIKVN